MADKFKKGDYVRKKASQRLVTGTIQGPKDFQGRYSVKYDPESNDTSVIEEGLSYEDELEHCPRPTQKN
jgi:hypothetical protein